MTNRKKGRTKFVKLKPDSTIQVNTRVIDIWGASDVKTNANLMVNGRYHFRPEANTINSRTLCVITRPGRNNCHFKLTEVKDHERDVKNGWKFQEDKSREQYTPKNLLLIISFVIFQVRRNQKSKRS
jgi:hypothetical protein